MSETNTAVATKPAAPPARATKEVKTIRDHLESDGFKSQIAKVLPKHITPERQCRVAITAMMRNPDLAECDQTSFFNAMMTCSSLGLEPDGRLAHLVPFWNTKRNCYECTLIVDWKGFAQLAYRSGEVSNLHADLIYEGDIFVYDMGRIKTHVPHWLRTDEAKPKDEGKCLGGFAIAEMKDGSRPAVVMSDKAILAIKARSKSRDKGPWVTDEGEMKKKTVFKRLSKWLPLASEKYQKALEQDGDLLEDAVNVTPRRASSVDALLGATSTALTDQSEEPKRNGRSTKPAEPDRDIYANLQDILDAQNCPLSEFVECLVGDNQLLGAAPEDIKTVQDIRKAAVKFYVADDGAQAKQSIAFVRGNKEVTP